MSFKNTTATITAFAFLLSMIPDLGRATETQATGKHRAMEYIQAGKSLGASRGVASSHQHKTKKKQKVKTKKKKHGAQKQKLQKSKDQKSKIAKNKSKKKQKFKKQNRKPSPSRG